MSFTLYTLFYNKFLKPSTQYRFSCLTFVFLFYLFFGSYIFLLLNANAEYVERLRLSMFIQDFYDEHECLDEVDTRDYLDFLINASNKKGIVLGKELIYCLMIIFLKKYYLNRPRWNGTIYRL